jgi:hypothetical protein
MRDVPWWQRVLVHALIASVRTCPEPSVFLVLDGCNEELANLVRCCLWIAVLAEHDLSQLIFVPVVHVVLLLLFFLGLLVLVSAVGVQTPLLGLALNVEVV